VHCCGVGTDSVPPAPSVMRIWADWREIEASAVLKRVGAFCLLTIVLYLLSPLVYPDRCAFSQPWTVDEARESYLVTPRVSPLPMSTSRMRADGGRQRATMGPKKAAEPKHKSAVTPVSAQLATQEHIAASAGRGDLRISQITRPGVTRRR
jgi:hypothetical protein